MGAARSRGVRWRTSKSGRRSRKASKRWRASQSEPIGPMGRDEYAEAEQTDRLLLPSLRYWEVERDLIEERLAAITSTSVPL